MATAEWWVRTETYRLYPTGGQARRLEELLESQRELYNAALEHRLGAWRWEHRSVSKFDQFNLLTGACQEIPSISRFGVIVHRGTLTRLDEAFAGFYRRVKKGENPGYPRFRGAHRFDSVQYPVRYGWKLYPVGSVGYARLRMQGVGHIRVRVHRAPSEDPRTLVVRRRRWGRRPRWEAIITFRVPVRPPRPATGRHAGVDLGVRNLAAVAASDGGRTLVPNPRYYQEAERRIAGKQGRRDRTQKGSKRQRRASQELARAHRRVADARRNGLHQLSRFLVDSYDTISIENLTITNMSRSARGTVQVPGKHVAAKAALNRSILDARWGILARMLEYKAEEAGTRVLRVDPHWSSQTCSRCGRREAANRSGDEFVCRCCGWQDHADLNAAAVLDQRGRGIQPPLRPGDGHARADSPPAALAN
jgi:putative transposase